MKRLTPYERTLAVVYLAFLVVFYFSVFVWGPA